MLNIWSDSPALILGACIAILIAFMEIAERWHRTDSEDYLGALPSKINTWKRVCRDYQLTLRHERQEEGSWRKIVQVMSAKIREAMAVSARGSGETDDAVAEYRRPYRQHHQNHPDLREVDRFMGSEDELEYLRRSAGRCVSVADDFGDDDTIISTSPPKSGTRAKKATNSVIPIRRRNVS